VRLKLEASTQAHLDLTWAVALGLGGTPVRSALEAQARLSEIKMVHHVVEDSRELEVHLFPDNELFLDAQIQVEVSQAADPAGSAAVCIEAKQQGANGIVDRSWVAEEVDVALWRGSDRNTERIGASGNTAISLRTTERRRRGEDAVLVGVSKGGSIFTAKVLTAVVGSALEWLSCPGGEDGRECPAARESAYEPVLRTVVRNLIHDECIEDGLLIEALTAILRPEVEAVDSSNRAGRLGIGVQTHSFADGEILLEGQPMEIAALEGDITAVIVAIAVRCADA